MTKLMTNHLILGYPQKEVIKDLTMELPVGKVSALIGPNGSGKSTILKALARVLPPLGGQVLLDGEDIRKWPTKEVAHKIALLPQNSDSSLSLTVRELVGFGRFPYQRGFRGLQKADQEAIQWALAATGIAELADRNIQALSGGQRQRAWIAMALAQDTDIVILDEPTTYLDPAHQLEIMQLLAGINQKHNKTILLSIHDLNHASRFADHLFALKDGVLVKEGPPEFVMTRECLVELYEIDAELTTFPDSRKPLVTSYELRGKAHEK